MIRRLRRGLSDFSAQAEIPEKMRARFLDFFLLLFGLLVLASLVIRLAQGEFTAEKWPVLVSGYVFIFIFLYFSWRLNRRGHTFAISVGLVAFCVLGVMLSAYIGGLDRQLLLLTIPVFISGFLFQPILSIVVAALSILIYALFVVIGSVQGGFNLLAMVALLFISGIAWFTSSRLAKALERARQSERNYQDWIEKTPAFVYIFADGHAGRALYANPQVQQLLGYSPQEWMERSDLWLRSIHPDDRDRVLNEEIACRSLMVPFRAEYRMKTRGGRTVFVRDEATFYRRDDQPVLQGILVDITARKRAEQVQSALGKISLAALEVDGLYDLYYSIHKILGDLMPVNNFFISVFDPQTNLLTFPYFVDEYDSPPEPQRAVHGLTEYVLRTGKPIKASQEVFEQMLARGEVEEIGAPSVDWIGVPLKEKGRTIGVMALQSYTEGENYGEEDLEILTFVSTQVAMAIERKRVEQALRDSEEKHRAVFEAVSDAIFLKDKYTNQIVEVNNAAIEMYGYSRDEFTRMTADQLVVKDSLPSTGMLLSPSILRHHRKDGSVFPVELSSSHLMLGGREFQVESARDITERVNAEYALRESLQLNSEVISDVNVGILVLDKNLNFLIWNDYLEDMTGVHKTQVIGKPFLETFPLIRRAHLDDLLATVLKGGTTSSPDIYFHVPPTGKEGWFTGHYSPHRDAAGRVIGVIGVINNTTERKRAEQALADSEQLYHTTVDSLDELIHVVDRDLCVMMMNETMRNVGLSKIVPQDAIGRRLDEVNKFMTPQDLADYPAILTSGEAISRVEDLLVDERRIVTEVKKVPVVEDGRVDKVITVIRDITTEREREEQIKAALNEKEVLLREIHHRVKNNLQVMSSLISLQTEAMTDPVAIQAFHETQARVRSMALIHEELYRAANLASIDFAEYVNKLGANLIQLFTISANIELCVDIENIWLGVDTAIPCGLIINELVSNAMKYAFPNGHSGKISVKVVLLDQTAEQNNYLLEVQDNGIGFPEHIDFRRTESLGMQLVNILARQLRGSVELTVESGTRFAIHFSEPRSVVH